MRKKEIQSTTLPACIGVIMDGMRRWARKENVSYREAYSRGYEQLKTFVRWAKEAGIKTVIVYAFSTENWNRPKTEVVILLSLLKHMLERESGTIKREKVRIRFIGQLEKFPKRIHEEMMKLERETAHFHSHTLGICVSYGGRAEILDAAKRFAKNYSEKERARAEEKNFANLLWTADLPDPDLIIRTGGEQRLSNFLLWQAAYSELAIVSTYWPDFTKKQFKKILTDFAKRERRHGK